MTCLITGIVKLSNFFPSFPYVFNEPDNTRPARASYNTRARLPATFETCSSTTSILKLCTTIPSYILPLPPTFNTICACLLHLRTTIQSPNPGREILDFFTTRLIRRSHCAFPIAVPLHKNRVAASRWVWHWCWPCRASASCWFRW